MSEAPEQFSEKPKRNSVRRRGREVHASQILSALEIGHLDFEASKSSWLRV